LSSSSHTWLTGPAPVKFYELIVKPLVQNYIFKILPSDLNTAFCCQKLINGVIFTFSRIRREKVMQLLQKVKSQS